MLLCSDDNTIAGQLDGRPFASKLNFFDGSFAAMAKQAAQMHNAGRVHVPIEAARFYVFNHAVAGLRKELSPHEQLSPEDRKILERYNEIGASLAARMLSYIAIVCVREARHTPNKAPTKAAIHKKWGPAAAEFVFDVPDSASQSMSYAMNSVPEGLTMGAAMEALSYCFYKGGFPQDGSASYGGPKWGKIADTLAATARGENSMEVMLDVSFALEHNGGCMFNKEILFYNPHQMTKLLDCQRCGFIPALILQGGSHLFTPDTEMQAVAQICVERFGASPIVQWHLMKDMGAVHDYKVDAVAAGLIEKLPSGGYAPKAPSNPHVIGQVEIWPGEHVNLLSRDGVKVALAKAA